jgi:hypothetical protein
VMIAVLGVPGFDICITFGKDPNNFHMSPFRCLKKWSAFLIVRVEGCRSLKRLCPVSARQSGALRHRAHRGQLHNEKVLPWASNDVRMAACTVPRDILIRLSSAR